MHRDNNYPYRGYHFTREQIQSIFFIKANISDNSQILVPDLTPKSDLNCLYFLLYDYDYFLWNLKKNNSYFEIKNYIIHNNISYLLLDSKLINSSEINFFYLNKDDFEILYENDLNIIFKFKMNT